MARVAATLPAAGACFACARRLGVIVHLLCTRFPLFNMDVVTDNLVAGGDGEARLRTWEGIDDQSLSGVFAEVSQELEDAEIEAARDLIRWCLRRDPAQRPQTMRQVLATGSSSPTAGCWQTARQR